MGRSWNGATWVSGVLSVGGVGCGGVKVKPELSSEMRATATTLRRRWWMFRPAAFCRQRRLARATTIHVYHYTVIKMPREAEISINEREFISQALQEQIRIDGRAFDAFRPLELTFGDEYGVADVQLGKTRCAYQFMRDYVD
jgi:hypothetical protein